MSSHVGSGTDARKQVVEPEMNRYRSKDYGFLYISEVKQLVELIDRIVQFGTKKGIILQMPRRMGSDLFLKEVLYLLNDRLPKDESLGDELLEGDNEPLKDGEGAMLDQKMEIFQFYLLEEVEYCRYYEKRGKAIKNTPLDQLIKSLAMKKGILVINQLDLIVPEHEDGYSFKDFDKQKRNQFLREINEKLLTLIHNSSQIFIVVKTEDYNRLPILFKVNPTKDACVFDNLFRMRVFLNLEEAENLVKVELNDLLAGYKLIEREVESIFYRMVKICRNMRFRDLQQFISIFRMTAIKDYSNYISSHQVVPHLIDKVKDLALDEPTNLHVLAGSMQNLELNSTEVTDVFMRTLDKLERNALDVIPASDSKFRMVKTTVNWDHIGGYHDIKQRLDNAIKYNLLDTGRFEKFGVHPSKGLLLYGPSGCGKTLLVNGIIGKFNLNYISLKLHEVYSKYLGDSEGQIRNVFTAAKKQSPCVIFIDDIDSVGVSRGFDDLNNGVDERILSTLLNEMDGIEALLGVIIIGCTNRIHELDNALTRPGRFDIHIEINLPTKSDRSDILNTFTQIYKLELSAPELEDLAALTDNFTPSDLNVMIREAGIVAMANGEDYLGIKYKHIEAALLGMVPKGYWQPGMGKS